jgi:subtilase family serine protease
MRIGRLTCLLGGAGVAALVAGVVPAIPSEATAVTSTVTSPHSSFTGGTGPQPNALPSIPAHAVRIGALAGQTVMHVDVTLKVRDPGALTEFISALSSRKSPMFHHYLARGQFAQRFGPTLAEVAKVTSALRAAGLSPGPVTSNRLSIPVTASAAAIEAAFDLQLTQYRLSSGRLAYTNSAAPRIPASISQDVQGVLGLSNLDLQHDQVVRLTHAAGGSSHLPARMTATPAASGPKPCSAATGEAKSFSSYTANELAAYYGMTPLYKAGDLGQGVHIAFVEFESNRTTDIAKYESCYGISTKVAYHKVDGGAGSGAGSGEAALDIEDTMGLSPDASIDVYQGPNGGSSDTYDVYNAIVSADADQVISTSWGLCELDSDATLISDEQTLFEQAATQGQTVFAAAGDDGSTACLPDDSSNDSSLSADDPASQPYVVGVGGTAITSDGESVWNESANTTGAGGGGLSVDWCMPSYQYQTSIPGLVNSDSKTSSSCSSSNKGSYVRQEPDVAADADPFTGYVIYYDGSWQGGWGGTSAAAPLWAAVAALIDASPFCTDYASGDAGVQPEGLYTVANDAEGYIYPTTASQPEVLYDVTKGNNDYTPSGYTGGLYPATVGYDMTTGLGTPLVTGYTSSGAASMFYPGLAALMCYVYGTKLRTDAITGLSPNAGAANKTQKVTVTGKGFLPIAGADLAQVTSTSGKVLKVVSASCSSTTKCTVSMPALSARTVDIQISAEDLALSKVTSASRFTYAKAPTVTSLSPAKDKAGRTITIHGTNFVHVTAVRFGSKRGTKVRVISSTEITVTVPKGSGTVNVTVTAAGGTTKVTKACHFRYT